jgi:hypothetical protein
MIPRDQEPRSRRFSAASAARAAGVPEQHEEVLQGDRLLEEVVRTESRGLDRRVDRRVPGHHDDLRLTRLGADLSQEIEAAPVGEPYVEQDEVVRLAKRSARVGEGRGCDDVVALAPERAFETAANERLVVDDQQGRHQVVSRVDGKERRNVVPRSGSDVTSIEPP